MDVHRCRKGTDQTWSLRREGTKLDYTSVGGIFNSLSCVKLVRDALVVTQSLFEQYFVDLDVIGSRPARCVRFVRVAGFVEALD